MVISIKLRLFYIQLKFLIERLKRSFVKLLKRGLHLCSDRHPAAQCVRLFTFQRLYNAWLSAAVAHRMVTEFKSKY